MIRIPFSVRAACLIILSGIALLHGCAPRTAPPLECADAPHFQNPKSVRYAPDGWRNVRESIDGRLDSALASALDSTLDAMMARSGATGVSAAVAIPGRGRWEGVRGMAGLSPPRPVNGDDRFAAASITKMFTAVLIMQLIEERKLSIHTPIARWFPRFPNARITTVRHLLTHLSGIYTAPTGLDSLAGYRSPEEIIEEAARQGNSYCPGAAWSYSNTGYIMLGKIVEALRGMPLRHAIQIYLAGPFGLRHTSLITPVESPLTVEPHAAGKPIGSVDYATPYAAGSLTSTAPDLVTFLHALVSGRIINDNSLRHMAAAFYPMEGYGEGLSYGYGIMRYETPLGQMVGHSGGITGFRSVAVLLVEPHVFVSVIFNDELPAEAGAFMLLGTAVRALGR